MVGTLSKIAAFFGSKSSLSTYPSAHSVQVPLGVSRDDLHHRPRRNSVFASFRIPKKSKGECCVDCTVDSVTSDNRDCCVEYFHTSTVP